MSQATYVLTFMASAHFSLVTLLVQVAFFTNQVVEAGEELTWDYGCSFHVEQGIMFPFKCTCGSQECRGSYL